MAGPYLPPRHADEDLQRRQMRSPAPALSNGDWHFRHSRVFGFTSLASVSERSFAAEAAVLSVIINPPVATMPLCAGDGGRPSRLIFHNVQIGTFTGHHAAMAVYP
jgi:hypothetical protein